MTCMPVDTLEHLLSAAWSLSDFRMPLAIPGSCFTQQASSVHRTVFYWYLSVVVHMFNIPVTYHEVRTVCNASCMLPMPMIS